MRRKKKTFNRERKDGRNLRGSHSRGSLSQDSSQFTSCSDRISDTDNYMIYVKCVDPGSD